MSNEVVMAQREAARKGLKEKLQELEMSEPDADMYNKVTIIYIVLIISIIVMMMLDIIS